MTGASPPTDAELQAACVAGDTHAFEEALRRHQDRLWAVALRTLGDPEEAADALQDALVSAYRAVAAGSFRGDAALTTWLHRVVVNACLSRVRRRQARPIAADAAANAVELVPDPRDDVEASLDRLDVAAALATLPLEQRVALVLVDMQGLPVRDAALVLGVAEGTVKSRCARGRARLLPLLAPGRTASQGRAARAQGSPVQGSPVQGSPGHASRGQGSQTTRASTGTEDDAEPSQSGAHRRRGGTT